MGEMRNTVTDKSMMLHICIMYRTVSLFASTLVYLFFNEQAVTPLRIGIAAGMVVAGGMGAYLYKRSFYDMGNATDIWTTAPIYIEIVIYGLLLVLSGGFFSPYLWYFISALTMLMANERFSGRWRRGTLFSLLWCLLCALLGGWYGLEKALSHSYINTVIGFLLVAGGFYTLFLYIFALDQSQGELRHSNELLRQETQRSEQTLLHTLELYNTLQLFGISEPDRVLEEIVGLLQRTVAQNGCLLAKTTPIQQGKMMRIIGLPPAHETPLLEQLAALPFPADQEMQWPQLEIMGTLYDVTPINGPYGIVGVLITPVGTGTEASGEEAQRRFYLYLVGVLLQNLDLQEMVEASIISEEQTRIVSEIHDTVIQKLFAVACNRRLLETHLELANSHELENRVRQIKQAVESTMAELREAICGIRWDSDGNASLIHKLTVFLEEMEQLSGTNISLHFDADLHMMSISQKTAIYRIVCEAVSNAVRHGKASDVQVSVSVADGDWIVEILDNGSGFDIHHLSDQGQGLKNMYRMAGRLKGRLTVDSGRGSGTAVNCRFPC